ncbi:TPA: hypothetical protein ACXNW8_001370 [Clostridium botulinum]|uniref:hypothetical protein n=1 Tax=Clostridium botulinum TaxID=1491 RepID=UPI001C9AE8ED|nr:hypothetical protein [Clostridium botulinum]MBY6909572.1 hypothetical protein [Clostridium botulinum]
MDIVGKKGYTKSGYYTGLVGDIKKCTIEGFEHLYTVRYEDGSDAVTDKNDIEVVHEIIITDWEQSCSDGCCYEYGTELIIDDYIVTRYFDMDIEMLKAILKALGIEFVLKFESEN